jgi:hypothetical protein
MRTTLMAALVVTAGTVSGVPMAAWAQTLFSFTANGAHSPAAGLTPDGTGGFYGTTLEGGAAGE